MVFFQFMDDDFDRGMETKKNIETYFALLKRTAKKNRVEFFKVSSGKKKMENANNLLTRAIGCIISEKHIKNRLSCKGCEFYKTEHCK